MKIRFTDNQRHFDFCPLTLTRPVSELRFGILTIRETWESLFTRQGVTVESFFQTESYLQEKYP